MITKILKNKTHCYFISPHPDDAVFSAGGLMSQLSGKTRLTVINVFTSPGNAKNSISAANFLKQVGYKAGHELYIDRKKEDLNALKFLQANSKNLGEVDSLWRTKSYKSFLSHIFNIAELNNVYPTYRYHVIKGRIHKDDRLLIDRLAQEIKILAKDKNSLIFCPIGFGNHVDHLVVREACLKVVPREQLIFWSDFPYIIRPRSNNSFVSSNQFKQITVKFKKQDKIDACKLYESQFNEAIGDPKNISETETYYTLDNDIVQVAYVNSHLNALINSPKDYVYNLLTWNKGNVSTYPYDPKLRVVSQKIINQIKSGIPGAVCSLIGSTGLEIDGQGDIDMIIPCMVSEESLYLEVMTKIFGQPTKLKKGFIQWKLKVDGVPVDLDLLDQEGDRYKTQIALFNIIKNNSQALNGYKQLKKQANNSTNLSHLVAKTNFFSWLLKNFKDNSFPLRVNTFAYYKDFAVKKHAGPYSFAFYKNKEDKQVFVKRWQGVSKNLTYKWLVNEIEVYKILNRLNANGEVFSPKLHSVVDNKNELFMVLEKISGRDLSALDDKKKVEVFEKAIAYLSEAYKKNTKHQLQKITKRPAIYWLCVLPYISMKAIIAHPKEIFLITKSAINVYLQALSLIMRSQKTLVHRDFNDYNILLSGSRLCLIDFQLTCIADPLVEYAVMYLKYQYKPKLIDSIKSSKMFLNQIKTLKDQEVFKAYLSIFCIYDLGLEDGSHQLSLPCLKSINSINLK